MYFVCFGGFFSSIFQAMAASAVVDSVVVDSVAVDSAVVVSAVVVSVVDRAWVDLEAMEEVISLEQCKILKKIFMRFKEGLG